MPLTLKWWTDIKNNTNNKVDGKVAPETELEKKLKDYDTARRTLDSRPALTKAASALADVEKARAPSMNALEKTGFRKLAAECAPNSGRLLNALITEEKKTLAEAKKEVEAKIVLGAPQMQGLGPGENLRKKNFDRLLGLIKQLNDELKKTPQLTQTSVGNYSGFVQKLSKDVDLYCKDRPDLKPFLGDFNAVVAGFKAVGAKWGDQKVATKEMLEIGKRLARLVDAKYVA